MLNNSSANNVFYSQVLSGKRSRESVREMKIYCIINRGIGNMILNLLAIINFAVNKTVDYTPTGIYHKMNPTQ